jgi:hypothetical protein
MWSAWLALYTGQHEQPVTKDERILAAEEPMRFNSLRQSIVSRCWVIRLFSIERRTKQAIV